MPCSDAHRAFSASSFKLFSLKHSSLFKLCSVAPTMSARSDRRVFPGRSSSPAQRWLAPTPKAAAARTKHDEEPDRFQCDACTRDQVFIMRKTEV